MDCLSVFIIALVSCHVTLGDNLILLDVPSSVKVASVKQASLSDVRSLPHQLFGLDESQSRLLSDVSFFRRPSLFAVITVPCGSGGGDDDCAAPAGLSKSAAPSIRLATPGVGSDASEPLLFQPSSLADAAAAARLDKALLASTSGLADSSNPGLFAGLDLASADRLPAALPDESGLPGDAVRQLRLVRAAVERVLASGLLADSQPDALQIDLVPTPAGQSWSADTRRRVVAFAADVAAQLAAAAGPDRAFIAMATVSGGAASPGLVRVGRSLMAAAPAAAGPPAAAAATSGMNLAADYDQDFPIIFNLILWLCVVLALVVYAVAYGLWNIDPGKDSIIYRRGYAHAKKD